MWVDVHCWIDRVWYSKECACCACDPSVHISVPSIGFVDVFIYQPLRIGELDHRCVLSMF